jgi:hypothetical protein
MRSDLLVDSYRRIKPSILIIEYFPFAPRRFGKTTLNEPFNAIEKEQQRPIVVCSLRASPIVLPDIDADPASINEQLRNNFSCVLHHADPRFFPLTSLGPYMQTFPVEEFGNQLFQVSALHAQGMLLKGDQSQSEREITVLMDKLLCFRPKHPIDCSGAEPSVEIVQRLLSASRYLLLQND